MAASLTKSYTKLQNTTFIPAALHYHTIVSGVEHYKISLESQEITFAPNFRQYRIMVLRISIFPTHYLKMEDFKRKIGRNFAQKDNFAKAKMPPLLPERH